jgi:hypothetical protein
MCGKSSLIWEAFPDMGTNAWLRLKFHIVNIPTCKLRHPSVCLWSFNMFVVSLTSIATSNTLINGTGNSNRSHGPKLRGRYPEVLSFLSFLSWPQAPCQVPGIPVILVISVMAPSSLGGTRNSCHSCHSCHGPGSSPGAWAVTRMTGMTRILGYSPGSVGHDRNDKNDRNSRLLSGRRRP